jgi:Flp pilus assembly pilin Flp
MNIRQRLLALHLDEDGVTTTEYVILVVLVACVVLVAIRNFGSAVAPKYSPNQGSNKPSF